ncbi:MAG: hypothetical protein OEZ65_05080 [Gemmatimonadota bacterium]|nr:hypothetical protein [Gemmatimonadota bacterium]
MRNIKKGLLVGSMLLFGVAGCADLEVVNLNDADAARALSAAGDVESLITGGYNTWFNGVYSYSGPGLFLSNSAFQHNAPWANAGMEKYGRLPRVPIVNDAADPYYGNFTRPWYYSYRAIAATSDGLRALDDPAIADELGAADVLRDRAFARLVLGVAHATLAVLYDQGFVVDETTDVLVEQTPVSYSEMMNAAFGYFDEAISLAGQGTFSFPTNWMQADVTSANLPALVRSLKARYRAAMARTPAERAAVNWSQVVADVDAGISASFVVEADWNTGWDNEVIGYGQYPGWTEVAYWIYGMADQSGNYQTWLDLTLSTKDPNPGGVAMLIVTPDLRFPQGATVAEQRAAPGTYLESPSSIANVWARPDRGTWRWSYYRQYRYQDYYDGVLDYNEINHTEMRLLKAEGLYRAGDLAGAAAIINETRVPNGLNATDAAGLNTSCVPKLPDGACGDLWEMLKWEKRMEVNMEGLLGAPWYFDGRGWGDHWVGTPLQFPAPCRELQVLNILPCYSFGGAGGDMAATGSTYAWPFES